VSEYPLAERVKGAKERLVAMNVPIPDPNPGALARAQQMTTEERGIFGKMFGMFSRRPPGSSETGAASSPDQPGVAPESENEGNTVSGGVGTSNTNGGNGGNNGNGTFTVDPKVVAPGQKPPR
jgi:hypothetical protein